MISHTTKGEKKKQREKNISINEYRYPRFGQRDNCIRFDSNERNHLYMCVRVCME